MSCDLFGKHISEDTIFTAMKTIGQELAPFTQTIKEQLLQKPVLNSDESTVRVKGALNWSGFMCHLPQY